MKQLFLFAIIGLGTTQVWSQDLNPSGFNLPKESINAVKVLDPIYIAGFEERLLENLKNTIQIDEVDELAIKNVLQLFKQQKSSKSITAEELKSILDQKIKGIVGEEQFAIWKAKQPTNKGMHLMVK